MCISPILFNTVLDEVLSRCDLLKHELLAWVNDLVFIAKSKTEYAIINILRRLGSVLEINVSKYSILPIVDKEFAKVGEFMGIPVKTEVKYLGILLHYPIIGNDTEDENRIKRIKLFQHAIYGLSYRKKQKNMSCGK